MSPNRGIFAGTSKSRKSLASTKNVTGFDVVATSGFVTPYQVIFDRRVNVRSTRKSSRNARFEDDADKVRTDAFGSRAESAALARRSRPALAKSSCAPVFS